MKVVRSLSDIPTATAPIALTIGVFDAVHLGHQAIIKDLHKITRKSGTRALLTFSNHPSETLRPDSPTPLLMTFNHRLYLLEKYGIDLIIALPFTQEFAKQSYSEFLTSLHKKLPFSQLVLGEGATFGKNREGDSKHLNAIQQELEFETHYIKKEHHHKETISSGLIRTLVQEGNLKKIKKYLGRPYSLRHSFTPAQVRVENASLFSWSFEEKNLCMLPSGMYGVDLEWEEKTLPGIAFLSSKTDLRGSTLFVSIYVEKEPPKTASLNIFFVEYLHSEIDPSLLKMTPSSNIENFSAEPSLS